MKTDRSRFRWVPDVRTSVRGPKKMGRSSFRRFSFLLGHEVSKQPLRYATVLMTILLKVQISNSSTAVQGTNLFGPNKIVIPTCCFLTSSIVPG
jgi:hypothetical protein